jgi:hypothetical protein
MPETMGSLGAGHYFTGRGARGWAMTEIKLGRTPHSALSIPHLNGSFPVSILGWTIGLERRWKSTILTCGQKLHSVGKITRQALFVMATKFRFYSKEPNTCREELPEDAQTLAPEIAARLKCEPDDVRVKYVVENEEKYISISRREIKDINCNQNPCWIVEARECLRGKEEFDLIGATEDNVAKLKLEAYSDVFRWSWANQRYKFMT